MNIRKKFTQYVETGLGFFRLALKGLFLMDWANFRNSSKFRIRSLKPSLLIIGFSVILNVSCTSPTNGGFGKREGRTIHDIQQFILPVYIKGEGSQKQHEASGEAKEGEESTPAGEKPTEIKGTVLGKQQIPLKKISWIEAPLKEKHLKELGALRIKTVSKKEWVKNSVSQEGVFVDSSSGISFINRYYKLDYEFLDVNLPADTNMESVKNDPVKLRAFLFGKVDNFYGFPDTVYYILPHLDGDYLTFYRLGKPETIPYDQRPVARKVGDFLATPLVGYPVQYCLPEKDRNRYGEIIDRSIPNCEGISAGSAKYVQLWTDKKNKKLFAYKKKPDLFSADFFNGHWFYLKTEIQTSTNTIKQISDQPFKAVDLVEFKKQSDHLVVMDSDQYGMDEKDRDRLLFIPVQWKEYEKNKDMNVFNFFGERERRPARKDVERSYILLELQGLTDSRRSLSSTAVQTIDSIFVSDDFFSFNVEINEKGRTPTVIKYTFKRAKENPGYPQKQWYEKDSTQFHPTSYIERKYYNKTVYHKRSDFENFHRVIRFNPNQEEIQWHFSTQTPKDEWIRGFGHKAIELINAEFQEAGKYSDRKIKIKMGDDGDKKLGDIRYNILNLVFTDNLSRFSIGSNVAHPITGEVVSATANVQISHIVNEYIHLIRKYIRFHVWPLPWKILPTSPGVSDFLHGKIQKLCPEVVNFIETHKGVVPPLHPIQSVKDPLDDKDIQIQCSRKMARVPILGITLQALHQSLGFRHILSASADVKNHYKNYERVKEIFGEPVWSDGTLIWEDNLTDSHREPPYYSSVMDYNFLNFPQLSIPGKYDLAATRYLYFDQLETVNDEDEVDGFVTLTAGEKSILEEIQSGPVLFTSLNSNESASREINESEIKSYYICGGKRFSTLNPDQLSKDPFCLRWDYGRTPKETVANRIRGMKDSMMLDARRYESSQLVRENMFEMTIIQVRDAETGVLVDTKTTLTDLEVFALKPFNRRWSKLRNQLLQTAGGRGIGDFSASESDIEEYEEIIRQAIQREKEDSLRQMTEKKKQKCQVVKARNGTIPDECAPYSAVEAFYETLPLIKAFYKEFLFIPPKQCLYQSINGVSDSYQVVAMEAIRARVRKDHSINYSERAGNSETRESFINCQSDIIKEWAEKNNLGKFIAEVGVFTDDVKYFIEPLADDPIDEFSINSTLRAWVNNTLNFTVLEPSFRKVFFQEIEEFLLNGFDLNPYLDKAALRETLDLSPTASLPHLPRFPSNEVITLNQKAEVQQLSIINQLTFIVESVSIMGRLNTVYEQLQKKYQVGLIDPATLQFHLSKFTRDPAQSESQMSAAYREVEPFIYKSYQNYLAKYETPEKRSNAPFSQVFLSLPSILRLIHINGSTQLFIPSDEDNLFAKVFKKYNEYKACIEKDFCEQKEEKEGYIQFIESSVKVISGLQ
ncbi:MAG: hypothetical protein OXB86_06860 [Bdellovibrionales bacterium]|nr:hypothetical protein [Bdellovibrionales bacterium]